MLADRPEQDDLDPRAWADDEPADGDPTPFCEHCADTGWRPYLTADGAAFTAPCDRC